MKGIPAVIRPVKYGKRKIPTPAYIRIVSTIRRMPLDMIYLPALNDTQVSKDRIVFCVDAWASSFDLDKLGGAVQYRICYSKPTNLGHNCCAPVVTAEELCATST
jgi:hypothetical protein